MARCLAPQRTARREKGAALRWYVRVVKLVPEGQTSDQIAEILSISRKTVDRHRANILDKLGMRNRVDVTRYASRRGLVAP
jgi:DNA-binding NarL/FixJ family response regulator